MDNFTLWLLIIVAVLSPVLIFALWRWPPKRSEDMTQEELEDSGWHIR